MRRRAEDSRLTYNKMASGYDTSREGRYTRFHIGELSRTVVLRDGDAVLDVACGNGTLLRELSKRAKIRVNGIDIAENMVLAAKARCHSGVFAAAPCCPLPYGDESMDVITVCCAFHHFDCPQEFAEECRRVLRKSGAVYVAEPNFGAALRFLANTFWFPLSKSGDVRVYGGRELRRFFCRAGFQTVQVYRRGTGLFLRADGQE